MSSWEIYEESYLECYCGVPAKLRTSLTQKNPFRLFYNCPKEISQQCGFFHWADELEPSDDGHEDELNLIRNECIRLQERLDEIDDEHDIERAEWLREKDELTLKLFTLQTELDDIRNRIRMANEPLSMPPFDSLSIRDDEDEDDDALVVYTL